jgi:hypothetical protein
MKCYKKLNLLIERVRKYEPEANYYVNGESSCTINLHSKKCNYLQYEPDLEWRNSNEASEEIKHCDCGGY